MGRSKSKEIERKFLVKSVPKNLGKYPHEDIIQGYVYISQDGTEVRLRNKNGKYFQTIKSGAGKIRTELELELTEKQFSTLWPATEEKRLEKIRHEIPYENLLIEFDIYHGSLKGLMVAEVEFKSEEASNKFNVPDWFGKEVTLDKEYKNQSLIIHGIPKSYKKSD